MAPNGVVQHKTDNAWRMFRIMGEFAGGFEALEGLPNSIAIFGSARTKPDHPHYLAATDVARACAAKGFPIITGGGPGIMEAANKGAHEADGVSVGLCALNYPLSKVTISTSTTRWISTIFSCVRYVFIRTSAVIVMPGGFGTMDEVMETLTLVQTHKIKPMPIILYGRKFWGGLLDWLKQTMEIDNGYISPGDLDLVQLADSTEEVMEIIANCNPQEGCNTNFQLEDLE